MKNIKTSQNERIFLFLDYFAVFFGFDDGGLEEVDAFTLGSLLDSASSFLDLFECSVFPRTLQQHAIQQAVRPSRRMTENFRVANPGLCPRDDTLLKLGYYLFGDFFVDALHGVTPFCF